MKSTNLQTREPGRRPEARDQRGVPERASPLLRALVVSLVVFILLGLPSAARADISSYLLLCYHFDEASGTSAADASGNGSTGTLTSGAAFDPSGRINGCVLLDGSNDYVSGPTLVGPSGGFTFAAWVKPDVVSGYRVLCTIGAGSNKYCWIYVDPSGLLWASIFATGETASITRNTGAVVSANTWQHVVFTWDGGTAYTSIKIYVDGTQADSSSSGTGTFTASSSNSLTVYFGDRRGSSNAFDGRMDEVRLYSRALSAGDVTELYNSRNESRSRQVNLGISGRLSRASLANGD